MLLQLNTCDVRSWQASDVESLVAYANNRKIWMNLRDAFPHPYTRHDAREFIRVIRAREPETTFAIAVNGAAVGSIGFVMHADVERVSAEIGYWLAEPFWGRGITTDALKGVTEHAIATYGLTRISRCRSRGTPRRAACSRRRATCSKRGCAAARSRTAASPINCSTRSSPIRGHPKTETEPAILRRVRIAQRAPRAVGVEVPAAAADHAL